MDQSHLAHIEVINSCKEKIAELSGKSRKDQGTMADLKLVCSFKEKYISENDINTYIDCFTASFHKSLPMASILNISHTQVHPHQEEEYLEGHYTHRPLHFTNLTMARCVALKPTLQERLELLETALEATQALQRLTNTPIVQIEIEKIQWRISITKACLTVIENRLGTVSAYESDRQFTTITAPLFSRDLNTHFKSAVSHLYTLFSHPQYKNSRYEHLLTTAMRIVSTSDGDTSETTFLLDEYDPIAYHTQKSAVDLKQVQVTHAQEVAFFTETLRRHGLDKEGWSVVTHKGEVMKVLPGKRQLLCPSQRHTPIHALRLGQMYFHEFGVHTVRKISGMYTENSNGKRISMLSTTFPRYLEIEESLAVLGELQLARSLHEANVHIARYAIRFFAAYRLMHISPEGSYKEVEKKYIACGWPILPYYTLILVIQILRLLRKNKQNRFYSELPEGYLGVPRIQPLSRIPCISLASGHY